MKAVIGYHGHCFDGMASAAVLARYLAAHHGEALELEYRALDHQPGGSFVPRETLCGDVNAVVDFRYSTAPELTWFFDHHPTGVQGDEEAAHLAADRSGRKSFDPSYGSCCALVRDVLRDRFGFTAPELDELVSWADVIDAARYPDAGRAVDLEPPAKQVAAFLDARGDEARVAPLIERLRLGVTLAELAADPKIARAVERLKERRAAVHARIEQSGRVEGEVLTFELIGRDYGRYDRFAPYALFPDARYCVAVTTPPGRTTVSAGFNPWGPGPRRHDVGALCRAHGGGGHAAVGGVVRGATELDAARAIARAMAAALRA